MDIFFKGRGAVVIGAASGIGRAIAAALIETGASVLLCDRNYRAARDVRITRYRRELRRRWRDCGADPPDRREGAIDPDGQAGRGAGGV